MTSDSTFITRAEAQRMIDKAVAELMARFTSGTRPLKVFGLKGSVAYAKKVAEHLGVDLAPLTEKTFDDGETYVKSGLEYDDSAGGNVRGHNVFVISSLYSDEKESVGDKFSKLLMFVRSLKDASASEVVAVIPHLGWARQDRKTESRAPINTKAVAMQLEAAGCDRALLFDAHNLSAEQNAFRIPNDNLEGKTLFADWFCERLCAEGKARNVKVLTPDSGGLGRCERFRNALLKRLRAAGATLDDIEIVIFDKVRVKGEVQGGRVIGDVADAEVIAYDDMISTAATMKKACKAVVKGGGRVYAVCATHGLFCGKANDILADMDTKIVIADTVRPWRLTPENQTKLHVVDTTKMVADAIKRIHSGTGSISELLRV
jgi:ribose-phosphate pyrophosphokinase